MNAAIVGGNFAGLATGIGLLRAGIGATVYERQTLAGLEGAKGGIHLWPNALQALKVIDALERVLTYFRCAPVADKYAILAIKPFAEYRIVALSGRRGVPPRAIDDQVFASPEAAMHGVFLKRVQDLMES